MSNKNSKKSNNSKNKKTLLKQSIVLFIIVSAISGYIIINKGKIGDYSLVKIESTESTKTVEKKEEVKQSVLELSIDKKYLSSKDKEEANMTVKLDGNEIGLSEVEIESSDNTMLKVTDKNTLKAVSPGKVTVTAKKGDLVATAEVRVIIPIKSITFTATNSVVRVGKSLQMKLVATPSDANIETLKYTSSDESIATVNANGIVTGVSPGKVKITVTDLYSDIEKSVNLTIQK